MHKHQCPACGNIWAHNDLCAFQSHEVFVEAHTCFICGEPDVVHKYIGLARPEVVQVCTNSGIQYQRVA
jgi:hypothetical protein